MLLLVSDENFHEAIVAGLHKQYPELDLVRIRDGELAGADDPTILAWAAEHHRVLLTHDRQTMPGYAYDRVRATLLMPGVFVVDDLCGIGPAIASIAIVVFCSLEGEWTDQVLFLPWK